MFVASKFLDYQPLKMDIVIEKIAHNSFEGKDIKGKEDEILKTINYNLTFPTVLDYIDQFIAEFIGTNHSHMDAAEWKFMKKLRDFCIFVAMMVSHDYAGLRYRYVIIINKIANPYLLHVLYM
jgi:cyclin B